MLVDLVCAAAGCMCTDMFCVCCLRLTTVLLTYSATAAVLLNDTALLLEAPIILSK